MGMLGDFWDWLQGKTPDAGPTEAQKEAAKFINRDLLPKAIKKAEDDAAKSSFSVSPWAVGTAAVLLAGAVFVASGGLALIPAAVEGVTAVVGAKEATAVVVIGVMGVNKAQAAPQQTPEPTPDVQGQVPSDQTTVDQSNTGPGDEVTPAPPNVIVVNPGSDTSSSNSGTTTSSNSSSSSSSNSCDHPDGCGSDVAPTPTMGPGW